MKKITLFSLILLLVASAFFVGCGDEASSAESSAVISEASSSEKSSQADETASSEEAVSEESSEEASEEVPEEKIAYLYQVSPDTSSLMNCYVIKTATDKLIVIDGGGVATRDKTSGYLYEYLKKLSGKNVPEVEAWILSHMHDDHVTEFCLIGNDEKKPINVNNVYFNFPEYGFFEVVESGRFAYLYKDVESAYNNLIGEGEFEKCGGKTAREGDVIEIDGVKIEILLTYSETLLPNIINDTSMIFRVAVGDQTILFLGDAHISQGNFLLAKYGDDLKSDMVQMSHHGQGGVSKEVYSAIAPTLCLWPSADWVFDDWNGNLTTFQTREWMIELGVKYHLITGRHKTQEIGLPVNFEKDLSEEKITIPKK